MVGGSDYLGQSLSRCLGGQNPPFNSRPVAGGIHFDATQTRLRDLLPRLRSDLTHVVVTYGAIRMVRKEPAASALINVETRSQACHAGRAMAAGFGATFSVD